jgi:hypothetical protein
MIRYYVCGLGYDKNNEVTDYETEFGDFDTFEEAYEEFVKLQCRDTGWFFRYATDIYQLLLQLEECEETDDAINCIGVKNEWWILNPNHTEYAVEVNNKRGFVRQIDVFDTYEEACEFADNCNEPLEDDEYISIIFIDYNENGDEIAFGTVC